MSEEHPRAMPCLLFADSNGQIYDFPELEMAGRSAYQFQAPHLDQLIPLPEGSELFVLPHRYPVGFDPDNGEAVKLENNPFAAGDIQAVAAFISPAHTLIHLTAFEKDNSSPAPLPLFAYSAVGWYDDKFWVSAFRSDTSNRQDICRFDPDKIERQTVKSLRQHPDNRLIQHLGKCSLTYSCPAAKNFFLERDEAPLPCSPTCNARCLGCISLQPSGCCPSTQERIKFVPSPVEIAAIAAGHLQKVKSHGVVSFGQGCEGEPLLQEDTIVKAIKLIRLQTKNGTINLNTNASRPKAVARLAEAGLDSMRASMNSARLEVHSRYYRPRDFDLNSVGQSIKEMKKRGRFVSLNYFIFPGVTDCPEEFNALCRFIDDCGPDFIQLRNLNMDPDWYLEGIKHPADSTAMGIENWLAKLKNRYPALGFGYFNPPMAT